MKKFTLFFLSFLFVNSCLFGQKSNGIGGGAWSNPATWASGLVPSSTANDTIVTGDVVTVSSVQNCKTIVIESGGTLKLNSDAAILTTSGNLMDNGSLTVEAGTLNVGSTKSKYLYVSGGTLNFSGGTINVRGRYVQKSGGNAYLSGNSVLNLSTAGEQNTKTINIFSVTTGGVFSVASGSTAKVVLQHGNLGAAYEIHYSPGTSDFAGGSFVIENNSSVPNIYFDSDVSINNLVSNVGAGDTLHFTSTCDVKMNDFTIQSGKAVANAGARLEINGSPSLGSDGDFSFDIHATEAASVYFSQTPAAKVRADISLTGAKFHYIAAPVSISQTFNDLNMGLTGGSGNDSFFYWDEAYNYKGVTGNWVDILNGEDGTGNNSLLGTKSFQSARGYIIRYQHADHKLSLTGNVLAADQTIPATSTSGSTGQGWNLIGNPFTASIAANSSAGTNNFLDANKNILDPVYGGIYVWNEQSSYEGNRDDYVTISNAGGVMNISAGQAFMVKVKASGNISFPKNIQNIDRTATFYKEGDASEWTRCWFELSRKGQVRSETLIAFGAGMTKGLDPTYDAGLLKGNSKEDVFTKLVNDDGNDFAIQALPPINTSEKVQVGMDADSTGDYVLSMARSENLGDSITVYLEDKKTGSMIDLTKNKEYSFSLNATGRIADRFTLYFKQNITGTSSFHVKKRSSPISLKVIQHQVYVKNETQQSVQCSLEVMNVLGQKLMTQNLNLTPGERYSQNIPDVKGLVIISVSNTSFKKTKKIIF